jgi:glutamate racemase
VNFLDPAPAIARRVVELLGPGQASGRGTSRAIFTSGRAPAAVLARFGIQSPAPAHQQAPINAG